MSAAAAAGSLAAGQSGQAPWRRALAALLRKRVAVVCMFVIAVLYGAGAYTLLDAFGVDTGLQDPNQTNLAERRPFREADATLAGFAARQEADVDELIRLNPQLAEIAGGELGPGSVLPAGEQITLALGEVREGPSSRHWFGTDRLGRDLFSRVMFSLRTTLIISVMIILLGNIFLGLGLGLLAGYRGGMIDAVIMRAAETVMALPGLLILIVLVAGLRGQVESWFVSLEESLGLPFLIEQGIDDYFIIIFAMSFVEWGGAARFYRGIALSLRESDYILAAEVVGAGTARVVARHLFPGVIPWFVVGLSASLGAIAGAEVVLSWLGIGITPPTASFGTVVWSAGSWESLVRHPHMLLIPAAFVAALLLAFNLLGDALNDVINPRGR